MAPAEPWSSGGVVGPGALVTAYRRWGRPVSRNLPSRSVVVRATILPVASTARMTAPGNGRSGLAARTTPAICPFVRGAGSAAAVRPLPPVIIE